MEKYFKRVSPADTGNENGVFKDLPVRGVHHAVPAGNAFNQMYALLAV